MSGPSNRPLTYAGAGVDDAADARAVARMRELARSTHRPEVLAGVGPFAGLFRLGAYREPVLVSSTDSVGTKVKIAALLDRYEGLGVDVVNQSVNDVLTTGAEPLFFLDYIASSSLGEDAKVAIVRGVASACREAGCALIGGETATLPDVYLPGELDVAGFAVGVVERDAIIDGARIREGDALLALPSSGLHTNGYSLARHALGVGIGGDAAAERARLERHEPELGTTLGEALLAPHRAYVPELRPMLAKVKGIAHITGGGALAANVERMLPESPSAGSGRRLGARIDRATWEPPALFRLIQRAGNVAEEELWRTYNMGVGLVIAVEASDAEAVGAALEGSWPIGEVVRAAAAERVVWG